MTDSPTGREAMTDALHRLTREDVPGLEFLVLNQVMGWMFSEANPGADYGRHEASFLGGALFAGLDDASTVSLAHQPEETDAIRRARDRLVDGAHELASHGEAGLDLLIEQRVVPAMIGELERSAGNPTQQGACTWAYLLYSVSTGERHDHNEQVLAGFLEAFDAWSALLATL